jgi:hypothetical protein
MLEVASDYLRAAKILWSQPNLAGVATVNTAIAIEIILKSFIANPVDNDRKNTISEQYELKGKRIHGLNNLAKKIDPELYQELGFHNHEHWFEKFDNLFVQARYPYEKSSTVGYLTVLLDVAIEMFHATLSWYKESGNNDPWVTRYPDVAGGSI